MLLDLLYLHNCDTAMPQYRNQGMRMSPSGTLVVGGLVWTMATTCSVDCSFWKTLFKIRRTEGQC
eukprot:scaffold2037_cov87-Skeletonema_dohrnii-CCMP3373.AAC.3